MPGLVRSKLNALRSQRRLPRPSWPLSAILLAFVLLAGGVSLGNPLFESTDEIRHYRYVRYLVVEQRLPVQGAEAVRSQSHHPPLYYLLSALASAWVPSSHSPDYEQPANPFWGYQNWAVGVDNKLQYRHEPAERFPFRDGYLAAMIPRWVNVALGAATVWLTCILGRRVWPGRPALAWGAASLVAFNPQFVYLSGAINNDVLASLMGTAVLILCVDLLRRGPSRGRLGLLGLLYGLALLSKFHLAVLGAPIALALALGIGLHPGRPGAARGRAVCTWLGGMGIVLALSGLLAGWWFLRNWTLYGDPTGLNKVNELWAGRPAAGNWWALAQGLPYLWTSLWGRFGYGQIPLPDGLYRALFAVCLLGAAGYLLPRQGLPGWLPGSGRGPRPRVAGRPLPWSLPLLLLTGLGFTAIVCYYILIQPAGAMGRFLFPVLPALVVLLAGGFDRWLRRPTWTAGLVALGGTGLVLLALWGYLRPAVSYPAPAPAALPGRPLEVQFGDVAQLLAADLQPAELQPGEPLFVTLAWLPLRRTDVPYTIYVHVVSEDGVVVAQRDTWPGLGRAPTTAWRPDQPFVDTLRVDLPQAAYAPLRASVQVGLYEPARGRLPAVDLRAAETVSSEATGSVGVGEVALSPHPGPWPNSQRANFAAEAALVGYELEPRALSAGQTFTLTLYWQFLRPPQQHYTVFAQVLDPAWRVWGSQDGPVPDGVDGDGEVIRDVRRITLLPDTPPGSYPIQVGLFGEQGRLPVLSEEGHYLDDRVLLGPVGVR